MHIGHVSKSFGANRALEDVSLSVAEGEIVGLVGENGAGKTTLMRIVAGEIARDAGTIELVCAPREVSFVHQHFMLVNELTVAENLALALGTRQQGPALEAVGRAGMAAPLRMDRRVADLSVGEKAKLELVKALAPRPKLLILDEPTSALSLRQTDRVLKSVDEARNKGISIIFITHNVYHVYPIADRFVILSHGESIAEFPKGKHSRDEVAELIVTGKEHARKLGYGAAS